VVTVLGIAIIVVLIVALKIHPFLSLTLRSALVGLAASVPCR
jgi:GntP family gluconate:H+ symporter